MDPYQRIAQLEQDARELHTLLMLASLRADRLQDRLRAALAGRPDDYVQEIRAMVAEQESLLAQDRTGVRKAS